MGLYAATVENCALLHSASDDWHLAQIVFNIGKTNPRRLSFQLAGKKLNKILKVIIGNRQGSIRKQLAECRGKKCVLLLRRQVIGQHKYLELDNVYNSKCRV